MGTNRSGFPNVWGDSPRGAGLDLRGFDSPGWLSSGGTLNTQVTTMPRLHPVAELANRVEDNDQISEAAISSLDRSEMKALLAELGGDSLGWDADEVWDAVYEGEGSASVTKAELAGLVKFVSDLMAEGGD